MNNAEIKKLLESYDTWDKATLNVKHRKIIIYLLSQIDEPSIPVKDLEKLVDDWRDTGDEESWCADQLSELIKEDK